MVQAALVAAACGALAASQANAQITLLAKGTLTGSIAGPYADLSGLTNILENGVPNNLLGGFGSGIANIGGGDEFVAVPDRGPNGVSFNPLVDNTVSYINRFHTIKMNLAQSTESSGLPFTIHPTLESTTLFHAFLPLAYGSGEGLNIGSGVPAQNGFLRNYFTGRSDGYDPDQSSGDLFDARMDPESVRVSNDELTIFVSDEYGPYINQFLRYNGQRIRSYRLPDKYYVANPRPTGAAELAANTSGRMPNKGFEGLAISPDGKTLAAMVQDPLIQDAAEGGEAANLLRILVIDVLTGKVDHEFAYDLTTGSGVSEIVALNDHEILVDERDGSGLGNGNKAKIKQIFKVDLSKAIDVSEMNGTQAAAHAAPKTLFMDLVALLKANGMSASQIPAKFEGLAFGPDVTYSGKTMHTLWAANDNDFLQDYAGPGTNPNQFFVVGFTDADLDGDVYQPQQHFTWF